MRRVLVLVPAFPGLDRPHERRRPLPADGAIGGRLGCAPWRERRLYPSSTEDQLANLPSASAAAASSCSLIPRARFQQTSKLLRSTSGVK